MKVWQKQTVRWRKHDKNVAKGTAGAQKVVLLSKRFYGTLRLASGKRKQTPLTEDRKTSETLLNRLQSDEDRKNALGITEADERRSQPLTELVIEYESELRSRGNTKFHLERTRDCIQSLLTATKTKSVGELNTSSVSGVLAKWRQHGRPNKRKRKTIPLSPERSNVYARAIKGFSRWLWIERKADDYALASLRLLNANVDRRRKRRALTEDEIFRLLDATGKSGRTDRGKTWTFSPTDRQSLYAIAIWTGLRGSEISSLSASSFDLTAGTVTVEAAYSKRRREDVLPLHPSLIEYLRPWLCTKKRKLFPGTWAKERRQAKILRRDLEAAKIEYVDGQGKHLDFHALRYTFVSNLARGGVHPSKAQRLARHSDINLTMSLYTTLNLGELREAVDSLPSLRLPEDTHPSPS